MILPSLSVNTSTAGSSLLSFSRILRSGCFVPLTVFLLEHPGTFTVINGDQLCYEINPTDRSLDKELAIIRIREQECIIGNRRIGDANYAGCIGTKPLISFTATV